MLLLLFANGAEAGSVAALVSTDDDDAIVASATVETTGVLASIDAGDSIVALAGVGVNAALESTDADDSIVGVAAAIVGALLSATDDDDALISSTISTIVALATISDASDSIIFTGAALQRAYPVHDVVDGVWLPSIGSDLYAVLDDQSDADYIETAAPSKCEVKFGPLTNPQTNELHVIRYRIRGDGLTDIVVTFRNGETILATWSHTRASADWVTHQQVLTENQADSITDYADIRIAIEAA